MQSNNQIPTRGLPGGRKRTRVDNYFADTDGLPPSELEHLALESANDHVSRYFTTLAENETAMTDTSDDSHSSIPIDRKLDALTGWAKFAGFQSLLEAAQSEAKERRGTTKEWIASGGLADLLQSSQRAIPRRRSSNASNEANRNVLLSALCAPAREIYLAEWKRVLVDKFFRVKLSSFTPDKITSFSFATMYERLEDQAPCLVSLFRTLGECKTWKPKTTPRESESSSQNLPLQSSQGSDTQDSDTSDEEDNIEANRRSDTQDSDTSDEEDNIQANRPFAAMRIVVALCVLANACNSHFNLLQGMLAYVLYGFKVPRRALTILNRMGLSSSYNGLRKGLKANGKALLAELRNVAARGFAFWISCDNCTYSADVKNERLHNRKNFITSTVAYLVEPFRREPLFQAGEADYGGLEDVKVTDYTPEEKDKVHMKEMAGSLIWDIIKKFASANNISLPKLQFKMPEIKQLDPRERPTIRPMRTYPLDEGKISDMITILEKMRDDVGMTQEQVQRFKIPLKGDFATIRNGTRAVFRRARGLRKERLNFIEPTAGLFHLLIQFLVLLFQTHLGRDTDVCSLQRWMREIGRDKQKVWTGQKEIVREYRQTQAFFDIVLDGHIVAAIANACNFNDTKAFVTGLKTIDPEQLKNAIDNLATAASAFTMVNNLRQSDNASDHDLVYEKHLMFMQHGLVLRSLARGMRDGDSGRVLVALGYITIWFQSSDKFNYANETLHMIACIKRLWSPRMVEFWMRNCLVNMSGKAEAWMACDQLCEHVVREVKDMMHHNVDEKTKTWLLETLSPQILLFYLAKEKMRAETGAKYESSHSSETTTRTEVEVIAERILEGKVCKLQPSRETNETESSVTDLHGEGWRALALGTRIEKYVARKARDVGRTAMDEWVDEDEAVEIEESVENPGEDETWLE